jgi:hypothetical protein
VSNQRLESAGAVEARVADDPARLRRRTQAGLLDCIFTPISLLESGHSDEHELSAWLFCRFNLEKGRLFSQYARLTSVLCWLFAHVAGELKEMEAPESQCSEEEIVQKLFAAIVVGTPFRLTEVQRAHITYVCLEIE